MKIQHLKTSEITPYARNAKTHPEEQISQIAASIREFGFLIPIVVDKDKTIAAGHGRLAAAQKLGLEEVPVICADHLTKNQLRAFALADNKLTMNSPFDDEMLKLELEELKSENFNLALTGFDKNELTKMFSENLDLSVDDIPDDEHLIVVNCSDEDEQKNLYEEFMNRGLDCKLMT